ncbi:conserved hypothetical protein [Leishmania braziliensis MHOM/BR/75/M2904]|uniref:Uncharacterized protein n=2 Tax=Leishmania braziliensis TaxID=5660 RepID=A4HMB9_LEIBR|nr:conserved hypothetical protein [Leishmania braziliensis MHOM/BR/75/M2904]CAJ2480127.1 unnamed protein product [Leishmania braziliensis]CAM43304.1 conserved hypothetical protein [Leishmania braziliensis MHOM/BR/75/M2904]SYZ69374.1 hypothetical_protein [Leishmania braziliensis MHOM/BR/75/M2904]
MMAAPATTSLDKIRAQLTALQNQNRISAEEAKRAAEQRQWEKLVKEEKEQEWVRAGIGLTHRKERDDSLTKLIQNEYSRLNKPNDAFRVGKEVVEGVAQRSFLLQERRFRDADEVLRKNGNSTDTQRYMILAFSSSPEQRIHLVEVLKRMQAQWAAECKRLTSACGPTQSSSNDNISGVVEVGSVTASQLAWLTVLEGLSEEDIHALWEAGILDAETLLSLFSDISLEAPLPTESNVGVERTQNDDGQDTSDQNAPADLLLDEKIRYVQQLHCLQEITNTIRETELGDVPPIDLAPTIVKTRRRQFDNITEGELRQLEQYEESAVMNLSLKEPSPSAGASHAVKDEACNVGVPAVMLDRALFPSNRFLNAVAQKDAALRRSLERMERIKRETLLDPVFQEAVRFAHAVEEASVAPHLRGWSNSDGDDGKISSEKKCTPLRATRRIVSKHDKRVARSRQLRGPMALSPYSPEVIPYFYNDMRSIVPPRGAFNLPDPALTKAERAALRGRRRRARKGVRYSK